MAAGAAVGCGPAGALVAAGAVVAPGLAGADVPHAMASPSTSNRKLNVVALDFLIRRSTCVLPPYPVVNAPFRERTLATWNPLEPVGTIIDQGIIGIHT